MLYFLVIISSCFVLLVVVTRTKRVFESEFCVKLPMLCYVNRYRGKDSIAWGYRRWRFIRKDGKRDRRHALNVKIIYPTIISIQQYRVYVLLMKQAQEVFEELRDYMWLQPGDVGFWGNIQHDLWVFFGGNRVRFVMHMAQIFQTFGWKSEILYDQDYDILFSRGTVFYVAKCVFRNGPAQLMDVCHLPSVSDVVKIVVVTNSWFTEGASGFARQNGIFLMDKSCIELSFRVKGVVFTEREA